MNWLHVLGHAEVCLKDEVRDTRRVVTSTIMCQMTTTTMHKLVIGLFINRYQFGVAS